MNAYEVESTPEPYSTQQEEVPLDPTSKQGITQNYAANGGYVPNQPQQQYPNQNDSQSSSGFPTIAQLGDPVQMQPEPEREWKFLSWQTCGCFTFIIIVIIIIAFAATGNMSAGKNNHHGCGDVHHFCCDTQHGKRRKCKASAWRNCGSTGDCNIECGDVNQPCCYDDVTRSRSCRVYSNKLGSRPILHCNGLGSSSKCTIQQRV